MLLLLPLSRFSCVQLCNPIDGSPPGSPIPGILQARTLEHWSGLPFPSPVHESKKLKWSHSIMSDSPWPHGLQPTRLPRPWDFPVKSTGVGCHCLLLEIFLTQGLNPGLPHCRQTLYHLSHQGSQISPYLFIYLKTILLSSESWHLNTVLLPARVLQDTHRYFFYLACLERLRFELHTFW